MKRLFWSKHPGAEFAFIEQQRHGRISLMNQAGRLPASSDLQGTHSMWHRYRTYRRAMRIQMKNDCKINQPSSFAHPS